MSDLHKGGTLKPPSPGLEHVDVINEDLNEITQQDRLSRARFSSASDVKTDVENWLNGQGVISTKPD
ncbi:hypothetical protein AVEN_34025-1 [Araneus ventricosus]|uniref:Uncharacterized protein n=1 Tax=Araneus ventricosus TaxID=182803 RepID=A0A4Y2UDA1_ARAVE|nr:hypothetical protein AVEN_44972-1 [Araneus ventricosus]GBO11016.1 hypothetical protein AVEN_239818-1 [Araneus ventricosus]GBO11025.1 hypothetical protein AVEN_210289-1 [Araneus ventricosus]GBO11082.1 hypothetical protein AVEN_34025-1 [Araneus ventricosus]